MTTALLLSGGVGVRAGIHRPKQYIEVNGRCILAYAAEGLLHSDDIDYIQIIADDPWRDYILQQLAYPSKLLGFSRPGRTRQESIWNGLQDCREILRDEDLVLIHDAARPFLSVQLLERCFQAIPGHDGVLPVIPVRDTIYETKNGTAISGLLPRSQLMAGQAPELFRFGPYYEANQKLLPDRILQINGSTETAILAGLDVVLVPGDEGNFKVTTYHDICTVQMLLSEGSGMIQ